MFYLILLTWVALDLLSKVLAYIFLQEKHSIIWDIFYLQYAENTGNAFSIYIPIFFLKILTISLIIWIFYYYLTEEKKKKNRIIDISFALILAWAIWNWIERVFLSRVIDFVWVKYFAIFNLADSMITIWAVLYIYTLVITHPPLGTSLNTNGRAKNNNK